MTGWEWFRIRQAYVIEKRLAEASLLMAGGGNALFGPGLRAQA